MATTVKTAGSTKSNRKSYVLSVTPINYSLTEGTDIPAPPESPRKQSPIEPPAPGGGPLTSHPATPPGTVMGSEDVHESRGLNGHASKANETDSLHTTTSPTSGAQLSSSSPQDRRRPGGVRRLFSLNNLRSSFSSSRTSLSLPRQSQDTLGSYPPQQQPNGLNHPSRPKSPSLASTTAPSSQGNASAPQTLRQKKSGGNWFKRKSSMFLNGGELEAVQENQRPDTRESKRLRETSPAPLLPELGALGAGKVGGGDLGWDEGSFRR